MSTIWRVGMECEFVGPGSDPSCMPVPAQKTVYTVRAVRPFYRLTLLLLVEFRSAISPATGLEYGMNSIFFRPLATTKSGISIFERMLSPTPSSVLEDA